MYKKYFYSVGKQKIKCARNTYTVLANKRSSVQEILYGFGKQKIKYARLKYFYSFGKQKIKCTRNTYTILVNKRRPWHEINVYKITAFRGHEQ